MRMWQSRSGHLFQLFADPLITLGTTNKVTVHSLHCASERTPLLLEALAPGAGCNMLVYTVLGEQ